MSIGEAIRILTENGNELYAKVCKVIAVNTSKKTVDVEPVDGSSGLVDIPLQADTQGDGLVAFPKEGSVVLIAFSDKHTGFVILASEVDKYQLKIGNSQLTIDGDGIVFNGGTLGGMVKAGELTTQLNEVKQQVNDILTTLKSVNVALAPSGAYPFAPLFASINPLTKTQQSDIENEKVKQ